MKLGANYLGDRVCEFTVWAPVRENVAVQIVSPQKRLLPMEKEEGGYWRVRDFEISPGTRYFYQLDGETLRPDPASYSQPQGVHEASEVVDLKAFSWEDNHWQGIPLEALIIYELHVGTFTPQGTFSDIISRLPDLIELGINAIEIMPVSQFPGGRNWGYDGVYPFAVQNSYGGVQGLQALINACHQAGVAVILDVVYNHFGPEGNYTGNFAPYFTDQYRTPWGSAINFDHAYSVGVRNYFIENALYWLRDYHLDGLRLDAVHAIYDFGAKHFLAELAEKVKALEEQQERQVYLIAESDLNDVRVINPPQRGGYGIDAQWSDDFHHSLHTLLTGEETGYYADFGQCEHLAKALRSGFVYDWQYSPFRKRYHGSDASDRPPFQLVVCAQNHDQVGNRMLGDRLSTLVSFDALKLAAASTILSPCIPLLFMGEEYGEQSPFLYFISHSDPDLVTAVREGRKTEFAAFHAIGQPLDAQSEDTFNRSKLNWEHRQHGKQGVLLSFYQRLIQLRRQIRALKHLTREGLQVSSWEEKKVISVRRKSDNSIAFYAFNFAKQPATFSADRLSTALSKQLDSTEEKWLGSGSPLPETLTPGQDISLPPQSCVLYTTR